MENKCERCLTKKAIFNCPSCDPFHNYCEQCDNFTHSFNKTKFHKRQYIYSDIDNNNNNNLTKKEYFLENKNRFNESTPSFYKFQTYYNSNYNNKVKTPNDNNIELKSIKEQIKEIQNNMTAQINKVLDNIDKNNLPLIHQQKLNLIEDNYKEKINILLSKKNNEIKQLESELKKINSINDSLMDEINEKNNFNIKKISELTNIANELSFELNLKEEKIITMKNELNNNLINKKNEKEEEKERIIKEYEKKINNILNISEHNEKKLKNVIKEKDIIIQNLINCNINRKQEFNEFVNKIVEDNKKLKSITQKSIGLAKYNLINNLNY